MIDRNVDKNEAKESKIKQEKKSKKTYHGLTNENKSYYN